MGKAGKFFSLTGPERRLFAEAVFWCALTRMIMLTVPFRNYHKLMGKPQKRDFYHEGHEEHEGRGSAPIKHKDHEELKQLEQIGKAVGRASRNVPWHTRCFVEAIAAKRMMKRRNIPCTVYLGLKKVKTVEEDQGPQTEDLKAHAWTTSGDFTVTGKQGVKLKEYTVVSTFI